MWLDGIARFSITNGSEIIVDPQSQSSADDPFLRKALLSTPFGLLLIQRGLLPLHSSAIAVPHGAVLFLGVAGSGKSALAAWFFKKSFSVISDEIVPIEFSPTGAALACPGFPSLDLYKDSIKSLQLHQLHEDSLVPGSKHPINCEALFQREKLPVHKVYILQQHSEADILFEEVGGPRKAKAIMHHIYRKAFAKELQGEGKIFNSLMRHFSHVPACIIRYKNVPGNISALGDVVAKDLALW